MSEHSTDRVSAGLRAGDLGRMVLTWVVGGLALWGTSALLPGLSATTPWAWFVASAFAGVTGVILRPVLALLAAAIGWLGLLVLAVAGQAVIMQVALTLVPWVTADSFWTVLVAAWVSAALSTILGWLFTAGTAESMVASLSRGPGGVSAVEDPDVKGMLFIQLDGVPAPLLTWAMQAGLMPTVRRWVDEGSHQVREWTVQLPCTTPASQLGLLHGTCEGVPAFRWFDREEGRVLVANRGPDARIIEERASNGRGLLADDGASVSNLFTGDAVRSSMVFSRVEVSRGSLETRRAVARFVGRPDGFARSFSRAIAELGRERFQARRQRRAAVVPRVDRPWQFTGLRAGTNGLLRDVNLALVARELRSGRRSVYVDFVDYDEVAHHAGPARLESLQVLTELDQVVWILARIADLAPRDYEIVLLSDHGQSLGAPFSARHGEGLDDVCRRLMDAPLGWEGDSVEDWGRMTGMAHEASSPGTISGRAAGRVAKRLDDRTQPQRQVGPDQDPIVLGSGNLGLFYSGGPHRLSLEEVSARWPALVPGLAEHPGIAFVAGVGQDGRPVVVGAEGRRDLESGETVGLDPLAGLPAHSAVVLARAVAMPSAPDLYVNSAIDASTEEIAAFEGLVGSHGGLGGWQDRAMFVVPTHLLEGRNQEPVVGAVALHHMLVGMLEDLGHRRDLTPPDTEVPV